ncbi:MAG: hypothetical protein LBQ61_06680 [Spirochaetales bacterium]|jgi:hypothetical protein|nr:hypothetical protein [Spirochaetales bacterium]
MKPFLTLFLLLSALSLFALEGDERRTPPVNHQKIYPLDSEIYQAIRSLYIYQGLALPSTAGPWSGSELLFMLDRLEGLPLTGPAQTAYDFAREQLNRPPEFFHFNFVPTLELRGHANPGDFLTPDEYIRPWNLGKPFLSFRLENWFSRYVYGFTDFSIGNLPYNEGASKFGRPDRQQTIKGNQETEGTYLSSAMMGRTAFSTNLILIPPAVMTDIDFNIPYRTFASAGGDSWNLAIGRDRLSWGAGESGNFILGDHIHYHNSVRTSWWNERFKYTYNISAFPHQNEYFLTDQEDDYGWDGTKNHQWDPVGDNDLAGGFRHAIIEGISLFVGHRLETRLFGGKVGLALTEGMMFQTQNGNVDIWAFFPTIIMHNLDRVMNQNSILGLEMDWAPRKGLNVYGQVVMDDFRIPGENVPTANASGIPNALGYMLGVKTAFPLRDGLFTGSLEGVLTDPYLYLRGPQREGDDTVIGSNRGQHAGERGLNFIVANRYYSSTPSYYEDFLGYRWGGDAIVFNAKGGYRVFGRWNLGANLMVMAHGTHDKWTTWGWVFNKDAGSGYYHDYSTPTTSHDTPNHGDSTAQTTRNAVSLTTAFSVLGSWNILSGGELYGEADLVRIGNPGNVSSASPIWDLQLTLGLSWTL